MDKGNEQAQCRLGVALKAETIPYFRARMVGEVPNDQLAATVDAERLHGLGIYVSEKYVINAGSIISAAKKYPNDSSKVKVEREVANVSEWRAASIPDSQSSKLA